MLRFLRYSLVPLLLMSGSLLPGVAAAQSRSDKLDLTPWHHLPVLSGGRIMPLQTFARKAVSDIAGRETPTIDPQRELGAEKFNSEELAAARKLFPDGKPRKWDASEMLLSWLAEPEAWEEVPFLLAEHENIRELLGLEIEDASGRLRFASPAQLMDSDEFFIHVRKLGDLQKQAEQEGKSFEPQGVDRQVAQLARAFQQFRQLTTNTLNNPRARGRFLQKASEAVGAWSTVYDGLGAFQGQGSDPFQVSQSLAKVNNAHQQLVEVLKHGGDYAISDVEPAVIAFTEGAAALEQQTAMLKERILKEPPAGVPADRLAGLQGTMTLLASKAHAMAKHSKEMHLALYDEDYPLRVIPALNAAALESDRDTEDDAQPWLALQTVLLGSEQLLKDYPTAPLEAVRRWYGELTSAYRDRERSDRTAQVNKAAEMLAQSLRNLANEVEPLRRALPIKNPDADLLNYTQYPPVGQTAVEVSYNELEPFKWAWVISLLATACFALAFGVVRKPMFWLGVLILGAGLAWTTYGFYLRVVITSWAPVTNMYETVVYVPYFTSLLGAWFLLLPLFWPGMKAAWRLTALPGTWEASELSEEQLRLMAPQRWNQLGYLFAAVRLVLMAVTFYYLAFAEIYDGGNTILSLTPNSPVNELFVNMNDLVVWLVGLSVLLSSVWYLPRTALTLLGTPILAPLMLRGQFNKVMPTVYARIPFGLAATLVAFLGSYIAWYQPIPGKDFGPLQPVLRSNFWLTIHVLTIVSSYAAGALAWGLGNMALGYYLFGKYRTPTPAEAHRPESGAASQTALTPRPPEQCATLASYCYKAMQVAVLLLAAGTILGGLWADVSWGRFWGWDPKEVFALISLLIYLAVLHGRYAGWFGNFGMALGTVLGASAIIMSWYGVNFILGVGLHAYGFGQGGQAEVGMAVLLNWLFLGAAGLRYWLATTPRTPADSTGAVLREEATATTV